MPTPLRLVFGEVAELYDHHRPAYPAQLVDDVIALAGLGAGERALEVGAGTAKATAMVAARGVAVLAMEPSAGMAAMARRNCAAFPSVEIVESDFERWDPRGERFGLVYAAQSWHWIDPELGYRAARGALRDGGLLAAFWNRPAWGVSPLRDALARAYRDTVPELEPVGPMHPANHTPDNSHDWPQLTAAAGFGGAEFRRYPWQLDYSADAYAGLLSTLSEIASLEPDRRFALLAAVRAAIEEHGGTLPMPMSTLLCLARARPAEAGRARPAAGPVFADDQRTRP